MKIRDYKLEIRIYLESNFSYILFITNIGIYFLCLFFTPDSIKIHPIEFLQFFLKSFALIQHEKQKKLSFLTYVGFLIFKRIYVMHIRIHEREDTIGMYATENRTPTDFSHSMSVFKRRRMFCIR